MIVSNPKLKDLSNWSKFNSKNVYTNKKFQKILEFYLFQCPINYTSVRSQPFSKHGWQKKHFSVLSRKLRNAGERNIKFFIVPVKDLYNTMQQNNQLESVDCSEEVVIYHDSGRSMEALFTAIRNAFAHGSYQIKTFKNVRYYCLENRKAGQSPYYEREVRARIVLKEETLLSWIKIIESGYPN